MKDYSVTMNVRIKLSLLKEVDQQAKFHNVYRSEIIKMALADFIISHKEDK